MPNNWKTYKLSEVTRLTTGFAFKSKDYENIGDLKVVRGMNITEGILRWGDDSRFWNHSIKDLKKYLIELDDIVIGMDGSKIGKNRAIIRENDLPSILAQRVARIQAIPNITCQKYIWQLINNDYFENYIDNIKTGTTIPHISLGQIGNLEIKLPPLQEQQSIASILSAIDDKIENNLAINKTLEEMAMVLYKHWFVDFGPFQDGKFVESELGMIPKGWELKKIGDFIKHKKGFAFKSNWYQQKGEIVVRVSDTTNNSIDIKSCERISSVLASNYKDYSLKTNDVVIATVGSWPPNYSSVVGKVIRVPVIADGALLNQNAVILTMSIDDKVQQGLLYCILKNERFLKYIVNCAQGSANQASIKLTDIFNYPIPLGNNIKIEDFSMQIDTYISQQNSLIAENQMLTQLRDTLLPKLISGEIRLKEFQEQVENIL